MTTLHGVRTARGRLHMARRVGARFDTACWRTVTVRAAAAVYEGRQLEQAWRLELRCTDCESLMRRGARALVRAAGW